MIFTYITELCYKMAEDTPGISWCHNHNFYYIGILPFSHDGTWIVYIRFSGSFSFRHWPHLICFTSTRLLLNMLSHHVLEVASLGFISPVVGAHLPMIDFFPCSGMGQHPEWWVWWCIIAMPHWLFGCNFWLDRDISMQFIV